MKILFLKHSSIKDTFQHSTDEINIFGQHILLKGIPYEFEYKDFSDELEWQSYNAGQIKALSVNFMKKICGREFNPGDYSVVFFCFKPTEPGSAGVFTSYNYFECNGAIVACIPITLADAQRPDQWLWRAFYHEFVHCLFGILKVNWKVDITDLQDDAYHKYRSLNLNATEDQMTALSDSIFDNNLKPYLQKLLADPPQKQLASMLSQMIILLTALIKHLKEKLDQPIQHSKAKVIERLSECIAKQEGFYILNSRSDRNNNPGNIMFRGQSKAIGADSGGFAIFPTKKDGWDNLVWQLNHIFNKKSSNYQPTMSIQEFVNVWASTSSKEEREGYAKYIASRFGVMTNCELNNLTC